VVTSLDAELYLDEHDKIESCGYASSFKLFARCQLTVHASPTRCYGTPDRDRHLTHSTRLADYSTTAGNFLLDITFPKSVPVEALTSLLATTTASSALDMCGAIAYFPFGWFHLDTNPPLMSAYHCVKTSLD